MSKNNTTKLLFIAFPLDNQQAGIHRYTREVIKALDSKISSEFSLTIVRHKKVSVFNNINTISIPRYKYFIGWYSLVLFFIIPLIAIIKKYNVVIDPSHFGPFNLPKKIKRITIIHDLTPILYPQFHKIVGRELQKRFLPTILKKASLIIANSKNTKSDLETVYPITKGKTEFIYLGINNEFKPEPFTEELLVKIGNTKPYLLFLGTIEPRKNIELLLDAYEKLMFKNQINHKLVLCGGSGWKNENIYTKIKNHPYKEDILVLGFTKKENLNALYSNADLFIYPSLYEGFGFPPLEAMSCGTKCLLPYNSSLKEVGEGIAYFYHEQTSKALAQGIMDALYKDFDTKKTRSIIETKFSWPKYATEFLEFMKTVL